MEDRSSGLLLCCGGHLFLEIYPGRDSKVGIEVKAEIFFTLKNGSRSRVQWFMGSGLSENPPAARWTDLNRPTSKADERTVTLNGEL